MQLSGVSTVHSRNILVKVKTLHISRSHKLKRTLQFDEATYIYAVVVGGLIPLEFVRRVVLISGQELTPKFAVTIRRCRQIEGETRNRVKAVKDAFA